MSVNIFILGMVLALQQATPEHIPQRIYQLNELERITLKIGEKEFKVWIADTESKRQEGLMFVQSRHIKEDEGMLFVYPVSDTLSFWMKNTYIPLNIAFITSKHVILNTAYMKPHDETGIPAKGPVMYALEMRAGTFKKFGIKPGMKVTIPESVKAKG